MDRDGNYLASWGEGVLTDAHGMFIDAEDNLYLPVKNNHVVLKYTREGNLLLSMGVRDQPSDTGWSGSYSDTVQQAAGPFHCPTDVGLDAQGDMYISDGYGNARVHKFTAGGELLFSWGAPGKTGRAISTFPTESGCIPTEGSSWPTGRTTASRFSPRMGRSSSSGPTSPRPCDIYVDGDDTMFVVELDGFVSIVTIEGKLITRWDPPTEGPHGTGAHALWLDSRGDIYVNRNLEGQRLLKYRRVA